MFTFGYMVFCILMKWTTNWDGYDVPPPIINIYTSGGFAFEGFVLWGDDQGKEQTVLQQTIFLIAVALVPLMLFPKPIIGHFCCKKKPAVHQAIRDDVETGLLDDDKVPEPKIHEEHEEPFGEIFIHQMIETIEFVLGCISNTASYLRLWALSLAHSQLAKVFLDMTIMGGIKSGNAIAVFIGFPIWLASTFGVLMCMDLMECFLHALRLHWVEFQNKFFHGDGKSFAPFYFRNTCTSGFNKYKDEISMASRK